MNDLARARSVRPGAPREVQQHSPHLDNIEDGATLAAYGYWLREKGWSTPAHMRVMRIDNTVAYVVTGIFVLATLVVGAELLYSTSVAIETGDAGLLDLGVVLQDRYGQWAGKLFLLGFWAAAMSSLVGVWNGVSLMFADSMTNVTDGDEADARAGGK